MTTQAPASLSLADIAGREFTDLVCADEAWVRAEFDALIAAAWPATPSPLGPAGQAGGPPADGYRAPVAQPRPPGCTASGRGRGPGFDGWARQRSPPPGRECPGDEDGQVPLRHRPGTERMVIARKRCSLLGVSGRPPGGLLPLWPAGRARKDHRRARSRRATDRPKGR